MTYTSSYNPPGCSQTMHDRAWGNETRPPCGDCNGSGETVELACPHCGSDNVEIRNFDFGTDPDTGYHDSGTVAVCAACNCVSEVGDFEERSACGHCHGTGREPDSEGPDRREDED